jgi:hypothetical protein
MAVTMLSSESDLISAQMFQDCLHQAVSEVEIEISPVYFVYSTLCNMLCIS